MRVGSIPVNYTDNQPLPQTNVRGTIGERMATHAYRFLVLSLGSCFLLIGACGADESGGAPAGNG